MPFKAYLTSALLLSSAPVFAAQDKLELDDFMVNCVSSVDQSSVTLVRSGGSNKGYIMAGDLQGEADILPGLGSMTFLLMQDGQVITFVVDHANLEYDMMVKGSALRNDRGSCTLS